jgi:hypothetical protein
MSGTDELHARLAILPMLDPVTVTVRVAIEDCPVATDGEECAVMASGEGCEIVLAADTGPVAARSARQIA